MTAFATLAAEERALFFRQKAGVGHLHAT